MLTNDMIGRMLDNQDHLNEVIDEYWRTSHAQNWRLAAWMECAELIDHLPWKWWKNVGAKEPSLSVLQTEVADIWHFILSLMMRGMSNDDCVEVIKNAEVVVERTQQVELAYDQATVINHAVAVVQRLTDIAPMTAIVGAVLRLGRVLGMSLDDIFVKHTAKYVLNKFRQQMGDKTGTYIRLWMDGREDNDHLNALIEEEEFSVVDDSFAWRLMSHIEERYKEVNGE